MQTHVDLSYLSIPRYHDDHRLMMYTKLIGASTSERASQVLCCPGMWSLHEMYAFTSDGRVRIDALSFFMLSFFNVYGNRA